MDSPFQKKKRIVILFISNFLLTLLIYADLVHFRYFGDFTSLAELIQVNQIWDVADSIINLTEWRDILFWIDLIILLPIIIFVLKKGAFHYEKRHIVGAIFSLFIGWFCLSQGMFQFYFDHGGKNVVDKMISDVTVYNYVGLLGYHYFDARRFTKDFIVSKKGISPEQEKEIINFFHTRGTKKNEDTFGLMDGKNLIIVQVEALQGFVIEREVNGEEITPFLNELKEDSMYFPNFFHQTGQGRTSDADLLVNTSLHPLPTGSAFVRFPNHTYHTMAKALNNQGYQTTVHHAFEASFWNRNMVYSSWGYDNFFSQSDFSERKNIGWGLGDQEFLQQSVNQMPEEPFYSFLITLTSHHPYSMPDEYHTLILDGMNDLLLGDYLQAIHYVDQAIGDFVAKLKSNGLWDNSIIVIYGDHDAGILNEREESGLFATEGSANQVDFLLEKNTVPLFIHLPGDILSGTYDTFGGQIDLAPTLLHLLGVSTDEFYYFGEDLLFTGDRHPVVFSNQEVTNGRIWYTPANESSDFKQGTCFDLQSKQEIPVESCYDMYEKGVLEMDLSQNIIISDWIRKR